jgi:hypothetical protein
VRESAVAIVFAFDLALGESADRDDNGAVFFHARARAYACIYTDKD